MTPASMDPSACRMARRVMKTRQQREVGIMDKRGVQCDGGARRAAAEKIHRAALAHQMHGGFPNHRLANGLDHRVEMRLRCFANLGDQSAAVADVHDPALRDAEPLRGFQPWCAPAGDGDVAAEIFGQHDKHQTNRPGADDQHVLSGAQLRVLDALHDAGERFDERGVAEIGFRLEAQEIFLDEPRGNGDGFSVSAVEKQQVFAKIFLTGAAMKTAAARRGIRDDHAVAQLPPHLRTSISQLRDGAGEFMAEDGGRHDHFGMITALENLEVRAAGKRGFDADADFARFERGRRDVLNLNAFFALQDGGFHAHSLCA